MSRTCAILLSACCALAVGCAPAPPEEPMELETVDVGAPIDAGLSTEGDQQAVLRAAGLTGLVPGDVPADLPLFVPASVVDFGVPAGGRGGVELDAAAPPSVVRRWLGERLPAAGWKVGAIGDELIQVHKGSRSADYRLRDLAPGTRIRLEYSIGP